MLTLSRLKTLTIAVLATMPIGLIAPANGAEPRTKSAQRIQLSEVGQALRERYSSILSKFKTEITEALPVIDEQKKVSFIAA